MSTKKQMETARQQPEEPDLEEQARILKDWRQREILNGTSKAIQEKIQERRRKQLLAGPYEKTSAHEKRSATVLRPTWTPRGEHLRFGTDGAETPGALGASA